ncbi:MAG: hypothetical protein GC161_11195 [Planctomycetaceae bacterium]|nr:hypothetical protein [Planctomycetaceae bacterium]
MSGFWFAAAALLLAIGMGILAVALLRHRDVASRIVVVDTLAACAVAACLLTAAWTGEAAFLDVAIGFALAAFLGTIAWAQALAAQKEDGR